MSFIINGTDLETTGIDPEKGHRIVEIAIARYITDDGEHFEKDGRTFTMRINPKRSIDAKAQAVHGISQDMLVGCPTWEQAAREIHARLFDCHMLVAHNIDFDIGFLLHEFTRVGIEPGNPELFCTMQKGRGATPMGKIPNLGELCWATGVYYRREDAHAADYDIDRTMEALVNGARLGLFDLPVAVHDHLIKKGAFA